MSINALIQTLNPGALVELFALDASALGGEINTFHNHNQSMPIIWQGVQYDPWPFEATGFERNSAKPSNPNISVGNVNGSISALCHYYDDLVGAKVIRRRTLGKFLDAVNFPGGVNPEADPNEEFIPEIWFIERKTSESRENVQFELSSALDFNGVNLPRRQIVANMCPSRYRSTECGYTGGAVADINDKPTTDPRLDACSKRLTGCRLRWGANGELPFGGFPAAGLMRS